MVRELLSNADYNIFDNYLRLYGGSSAGVEANIDAWASAKDEWLGKMFGNKILYNNYRK